MAASALPVVAVEGNRCEAEVHFSSWRYGNCGNMAKSSQIDWQNLGAFVFKLI
jgi:hypothetical protein